MFIHKNNYNEKLERNNNKNIMLTDEFLEQLNFIGDSNISLISVGNSLSAGYSKCDEILPFLKRGNIYNSSNDINFLSYARVRRNEEKNIIRWYLENLSDQHIGELNIKDIAAKKAFYAVDWSSDIPNSYRELYKDKPVNFRDQVQLNDNNVIIYNGLTGVFTNNFRNGTNKEKIKILSAFKEDIINFKQFLNTIYLESPKTQVYVIGLPNIMGTGIISALDYQIKKIIKQFPNVVFVKGTIRNSLFYLDNQQEFDVHYSQPEYLSLWNNLTEAMINNYSSLKLRLEVLNELKNYSEKEEYKNTLSKGDLKDISVIIKESIGKHNNKYVDLEKEVSIITKYYENNYLSSYSSTPKNETVNELLLYK